ncbi:FAD-dependent monooxygenase [Xanthobacter sp. TB0139]|uniref:FAD-dependent monooxygenase n=1 Tax=Xanthobacter sp. TB0139 TaxID=3459178 RepID=UPI004039D5A2
MPEPIPFPAPTRLAARSAVVVGGGIGGLACAIALRRAGLTVQIIERARKLREVGAGLQLTPNATRILRDMGLMPRLEEVAVAPRALDVRSGRSGSTLARAEYGPATTRFGAPFMVVHRADLQKILADTAEAEGCAIALDSELTSLEPSARSVRAVVRQGQNLFAHGADILIGADGVRSTVRNHLYAGYDGRKGPPAGPVFAQRVAYRTTINAPDNYPPEVRLYLGPNAHLVAYPVKGGNTLNIVAIVKETKPVGRWNAPGNSLDVLRPFANWAPEVLKLLESAPHFLCWGLYDIAPLPRWSFGRMTLLGDAAHAMLPFLAQGAAQSIEDAAELARALQHNSDAEAALHAYEAARRARTARIQTDARRNGSIYHFSGPARIARDLVIRRTGQGLLDRYDWIYSA